ncbi:hypothetical protein A1O7_00125 [Cladophialophora yegresii CBS 114405]|uniref:Copper transport protein n=1 Tax=Cladophialophora yegresii CBS 114405 TaxID=1182544 RepID=W9WFK5_9EURO|nr:uncharacterized protein A1O7_00125 [Cladophialophora yegresii CBS 114405]EXJ63790.1 hypothetical protein A1O7_00125 [Cladophialophora yegresii CBS 114405]
MVMSSMMLSTATPTPPMSMMTLATPSGSASALAATSMADMAAASVSSSSSCHPSSCAASNENMTIGAAVWTSKALLPYRLDLKIQSQFHGSWDQALPARQTVSPLLLPARSCPGRAPLPGQRMDRRTLIQRHVIRSLGHTVQSGLAYFVMLLAMSYNGMSRHVMSYRDMCWTRDSITGLTAGF